MGQGVWTALPQILADALGADWQKMGVEPAAIGPAYANELLLSELERRTLPAWAGSAGRLLKSWPDYATELQAPIGSNSLPAFHDSYARAGALARVLLLKAAAERFGTDWTMIPARGGFVLKGAEPTPLGPLAEAVGGFAPQPSHP